MSEGEQIDDVLLRIEIVNDPIIARTKAILVASFQAMMCKPATVCARFRDFGFDQAAVSRAELKENRIELTRVNFLCLCHARKLANPNAAFGDVALSAFDACLKFIRQLALIFEHFINALAELFDFTSRPCTNRRFNLLNSAHEFKLSHASVRAKRRLTQ